MPPLNVKGICVRFDDNGAGVVEAIGSDVVVVGVELVATVENKY
jgi:hypothetical protein